MNRTDQEDQARRHLRAGIARVALRHKRSRSVVDSYGKPLSRAVEMAERHSTKTLERWTRKDQRRVMVRVS